MKSILILDAFITDEADENLLTNFIDSSRQPFREDLCAEACPRSTK